MKTVLCFAIIAVSGKSNLEVAIFLNLTLFFFFFLVAFAQTWPGTYTSSYGGAGSFYICADGATNRMQGTYSKVGEQEKNFDLLLFR